MDMEFVSDLFLFFDANFHWLSELHKILASICVDGVFLTHSCSQITTQRLNINYRCPVNSSDLLLTSSYN